MKCFTFLWSGNLLQGVLAVFQSPQIILAVLDLGQHRFLHSHLKIWWGLSGVALGTLRLSSHSKFIKIDGFFGALDTWKPSECGL